MQKKISDIKNKEQEYTTPYYKLVLIGENEVGKTQMLHRLNDENFEERYSPTFGVDFRVKSFFGEKGKLLYDLQILDIAGETDDIHLKIEKDFINDASAFLCLFDISNVYSLDKAIKIMEQYKSKIDTDVSKKKWFLIGNKKDLDVNGNGVPNYYKTKFDNYFEVSAKTSTDQDFQKIINDITAELNLSEKENRFQNIDNSSSEEPFEIDFEKSHGKLFDEECKIF